MIFSVCIYDHRSVCNIADDTTPYACENLPNLLQNLENDMSAITLSVKKVGTKKSLFNSIGKK